MSCIGFGDGGKRKTTQAWDVQQAITVQRCGAMGGCDILRNMVQVPESKVATDGDFVSMMNEIFGPEYKPGPGMDMPVAPGEVATDAEVSEMFAEVFGAEGQGSGTQRT